MYKLKVFILLIAVAGVSAAPFFDALFDVLSGNSRRSYGYGYNNYGSYGQDSGREYRSQPKQGRSYKQLCRAHFPDSFGAPGSAGVVCPY